MALILLVDDDAAIRGSLARILERAGYDVDTASNGHEAIAAMRRRQADLVITDILMPEKEGMETIIQMRKEYPRVPLIAMSGGGIVDAAHYLDSASNLGADRTFQKPIDYRELLEAVDTLLSG